jgi:VWFA-related protein
MFVMRKQVNEVALHATVLDDQERIITDLNRSAFTVFEDGHPQAITSFRHEDVPISLGILIDNSGSMREKRAKVDAAALNLVRASNPDDEVLIVNFNDEGILDQDFTSDIGRLKEALERHETRGLTALYDAVDGAAAHLKGSATREKRAIFVVTDGEDTASRDTLDAVLASLQQEGAPTVYAIGILGEQKQVQQQRARQALQLMAQRTGGIAFFPKTLDEVDQISRSVARDIRNQYAIGYKPLKPRSDGGYRVIRVEARAHGYRNLKVRTKRGYDATQNSGHNPPLNPGQ